MQQATATDRYVRQMSEYRNDSCCEAVDNSVRFVDIVTPTLANSDHMVVAPLMLTGCLSINFLIHGVLIQRMCGLIIFLQGYNAHM